MTDKITSLNRTYRKLRDALECFESVNDRKTSREVRSLLGRTLSEQFDQDAVQLAYNLVSCNDVISPEAISLINRVLDTRMTRRSIERRVDDRRGKRFFGAVPPSFRVATAFDNILFREGRTGTPVSELMLDFFEAFGIELMERTGNDLDAQADDLASLTMAIHSYLSGTLTRYRGRARTRTPRRPANRPPAPSDATAAPKDPTGSRDPDPSPSPQATPGMAGSPALAEGETLESLMDELDSLVGLESVKQDVHSLINLLRVRKAREERGIEQLPMSLHLVFSGNPGTGKTTVARLVAKIYAQIGVLERGQLIETDRSGLVGGYVGHTGPKVKEVVERALGGVLFIDEAYSLTYKRDSRDFGFEAVDTLLKEMEDHRDELIVIVAGYTEPMQGFLASNPGLRSRFNKFITFPDYTPEELYGIFEGFCEKGGFTLTNAAAKEVRQHFTRIYEERDETFANGREVRNFFERMLVAQANRLAQEGDLSDSKLQKITVADVR